MMLLLFLMLLPSFCLGEAADFTWSLCEGDINAVCLVIKKPDSSELSLSRDATPHDTAIIFIPEKKNRWQIHILDKGQKKSEGATLNQLVEGANEVKISCKNNKLVLHTEKLPDKSLNPKIEDYSPENVDYVHCIFIISVAEDLKVLTFLEANFVEDKLNLKSGNKKYEFDRLFSFDYVSGATPCKSEDLFKKNCDENEDCIEVGNTWKCPVGYFLRLRESPTASYEGADLRCKNGEFNRNQQVIPSEADAKCARKKCTLCTPKASFINLTRKDDQEIYDKSCSKLKCDDTAEGKQQFMIINNIMATSGDIQCSSSTRSAGENEAKWTVKGKEIPIETAVCKENVECQSLNKIKTYCESEDDPNCEDAQQDLEGSFFCEKGELNMRVNSTNFPITVPSCKSNGEWNITFIPNENSETIDEPLPTVPQYLVIRCILKPEPQVVSAGDSGNSVWIIIVVIVLLMIVVILSVALFFFFRSRNSKRNEPAYGTGSRNSSATSSSKKMSSSELEPLTSAVSAAVPVETNTQPAPAPPAPMPPSLVLSAADIRKSGASETNLSGQKNASAEASKKEKKANAPNSDDRSSQTGGDEESQPDQRKSKKQSRTKSKKSKGSKKINDSFVNVTKSDIDLDKRQGN